MEPEILQAGAEAAGERLDSFLAKSLPELTRSAAQRLIENGRVAVDGRPAVKSCRLSGGEAVSVILPEPDPLDAAPQAIALDGFMRTGT